MRYFTSLIWGLMLVGIALFFGLIAIGCAVIELPFKSLRKRICEPLLEHLRDYCERDILSRRED